MKKPSFLSPADSLEDNVTMSDESNTQKPLSTKMRLILGIGAAVLILALAVALPSVLQAVTPSEQVPTASASQHTQDSSAIPAGDSELMITAYAAEWKQTALQPGVALPLNAYSPAQSDVPGLPFIITAGEDLGKDSIRIDVSAGSLITWGAPDYSAKQRGSTFVLSSGDTIYWSPIDAGGKAIAQCEMTVSAFDNANQAHAVTIEISQTADNTYTAEIKK